jgi:hypothetical protein
MKLGNLHHSIKLMCQGEQFDASIYLEYRATRQRMNRYLYQVLIDEGLKPRDVYDIQFFVDGQAFPPSIAPPLPCSCP